MLSEDADHRPPPARADDGNPWVDGWCWLWCGHRYTRVLWLGPVLTAGKVVAPLYACGACVATLHDMVWDFSDASADAPTDRDGRAVPLYRAPGEAPPAYPSRGRYRFPRTVLGECFLAVGRHRREKDIPVSE